MPTLIGQSLGRYRILEHLGEGGMAKVYKAHDTRLERDVAIKIIRREVFPPAHLNQILRRFEREAKALAKLSHPNIVGVIDYGDYEGSPYLVMEFLSSGTLNQRLGKPIPWQEAVRLLLPVARAVQFAHAQGIIHRDIKPSNILITLSGEPMLSDFGIAKILNRGDATTLTETGTGLGTPEYMAPEQWTGAASAQTDIYSLGVVFYEMITGRRPYTADTPAAIFLKQATEPLPRPTEFVPSLPEEVEEVILTALAFKPEQRFSGMEDFAESLDHLLTGQPAKKRKIQVIPPPDVGGDQRTEEQIPSTVRLSEEKPPDGSRRSWWLLGVPAALICLLLLVGLGGAGILSIIPKSPTATKAASASRTAPGPATPFPAAPVPDTPVPTVTPANVTITWWHINTAENQIAYWQQLADEYTALHPNVAFAIRALDAEVFKTDLAAAVESGNPPDIFHEWPGNAMKEHVKAGLLRDITPELDADGGAWRNAFSAGTLSLYSLDGSNYGVPWDMGMVGIWYSKALFRRAGVGAPIAAWSDLLAGVEKLRAAGITPIAIGGGDKWPAAFWWEYLATRIGGKAAYDAAANIRTGAFTDAPFVQAGGKLLELVGARGFQNGFLFDDWYNRAGQLLGNGEAAMELMGHWGPEEYQRTSADWEAVKDDIGWFPFPVVEGGAGGPYDAIGSGNGFAIGKDADDAAVDFVKYLTRRESQIQCAQIGFCIPAVKGGEEGMNNPLLIPLQQALARAEYLQLYYDQDLPPAVGSVIDDSVYAIMSQAMTPRQAAAEIEAAVREALGDSG